MGRNLYRGAARVSAPAATAAEPPERPNLRARFGWLFGALGGLPFTYLSILQIVEFSMKKKDVVRVTNAPVVSLYGGAVALFRDYVELPLAATIRQASAWLASSTNLYFPHWLQDVHVSTFVAATLLALAGISTLYFSLLGLLRMYDAVSAIRTLRRFAFLVISIILLPLAVLSIVHVVRTIVHIELMPLADNLVSDYVTVTRTIADAIYGGIIPWHVPIWLKDAAAISVISVGINRKAWLGNEAGRFPVDWDDLVPGLRSMFEITDVFVAIKALPQLVSALLAYAVGRLFVIVRLRWLGERAAALVYILSRGLLLMGLIYPFEHIYRLLSLKDATSEAASQTRAAALWYMAYFSVALILVVWFVQGLSYALGSHGAPVLR